MTSGGGVRAVCGAVMAAMGVALGISGAYADDLVGSEEIGASDAGGAASMAAGSGRRLWSRQPGTSDDDVALDVATDTDGNVYVVGYTLGALGGRNKGFFDAWVIKFDGDGRRLWSRQPGTSDFDRANGVATDTDGNIYVVGEKGIEDAWVIKFDGDGHRLWSRQPGTSTDDSADGVATDMDGNVYVVGFTFGALGGANNGRDDAWVIKFDGDGHRVWSRQPGTSDFDGAAGVATDTDGNVYVVGSTSPPMSYLGDAFLIKFARDGDVLWKRQPGTSMLDLAFGVTTDKHSNVSVVGWTDGSLGGPNKGIPDAWVIKYAR